MNPKITCPTCKRKITLSEYNREHLITPHHRDTRTGKKCPQTFTLVKISSLQK